MAWTRNCYVWPSSPHRTKVIQPKVRLKVLANKYLTFKPNAEEIKELLIDCDLFADFLYKEYETVQIVQYT